MYHPTKWNKIMLSILRTRCTIWPRKPKYDQANEVWLAAEELHQESLRFCKDYLIYDVLPKYQIWRPKRLSRELQFFTLFGLSRKGLAPPFCTFNNQPCNQPLENHVAFKHNPPQYRFAHPIASKSCSLLLVNCCKSAGRTCSLRAVIQSYRCPPKRRKKGENWGRGDSSILDIGGKMNPVVVFVSILSVAQASTWSYSSKYDFFYVKYLKGLE